ncbi:MAG TPA: DUF3455 domain-containing protein [Luteitalea sp.]|nr:DUF3455 domain-containing protein [Luteitalea sp.]
MIRSLAVRSLLVVLSQTAPALAQTPVPAALQVPAGHQAFLTTRAEGAQQYVCTAGRGGFTWLFYGPQATLTDDGGAQVATHFLSANPDEAGAARATWQDSTDTSRVWAAAMASSTDSAFAPGAIPWLLLRVVGSEPGPNGGNTLGGTLYIQRVNTAGGVAPTTGCRNAHDVGRKALVAYETDYVFYK